MTPKVTKLFSTVKHSQGLVEKLCYIYGQRLHKWMVSKDAHFYLKPTDIISHRPTLFGYHEPHIEKLIRTAATDYGDFFLDLGANIGLTSALTGGHFKRVDCVEPNALVFNIMKTNLALHLGSVDVACHPIGLGTRDGTLTLKIPADNFGGAYLAENNALAAIREGGTPPNESRPEAKDAVFDRQVQIKSATAWLTEHFNFLNDRGLQKGVIKIDVEGYEEVIFKAILSTLPKPFEAVVIMENWFDRFPIAKFQSPSHDLGWFYFKKHKRRLHSLPFKLLGLSNSYEMRIEELAKDTPNPHDVICTISKK